MVRRRAFLATRLAGGEATTATASASTAWSSSRSTSARAAWRRRRRRARLEALPCFGLHLTERSADDEAMAFDNESIVGRVEHEIESKVSPLA